MAIANTPLLYIPPLLRFTGAPSVFESGFLMDASGEKAAFIGQAPKTGSIRKVHFRLGTVTTPTDTDVRIETVSATDGNPTGTLFGTNTNGTLASGSITTGAWATTTMTADASVTAGDILAIVIAPTGSPNFRMSQLFLMSEGTSHGATFPYCEGFLSSTWTRSDLAFPMALEYSDGSFDQMPFAPPIKTLNSHSVSSSTTPDEIALYFRLAAPVRVWGAWLWADFDGDCDIVLYDSDGSTPLLTSSHDKDIRRNANAGTIIKRFSSSATLVASTFYRLALKPTSTTAITAYSFDVNAAGILDAVEGGQDFHWSQRTDAGAWSQTTTRRMFGGLIIDGIDAGGSAGGGGPLAGGRLAQ